MSVVVGPAYSSARGSVHRLHVRQRRVFRRHGVQVRQLLHDQSYQQHRPHVAVRGCPRRYVSSTRHLSTLP